MLRYKKCKVYSPTADHREEYASEMAQKLGIEVVAEGVEEEADLRCLQAMRCDKIQGYIFSPAVSRQEFEKLMIRQPFYAKFKAQQGG